MIGRYTKEQIADYFDPPELVDYLGVSSIAILDAFEDELEDAMDDIAELIGLKYGDDDE